MKLIQKIAVTYIRTKLRLLRSMSAKKAARSAFELFCTPQSRDVINPLPPVFKEAEALQFEFDEYHIVGYRWNMGGSRKVLIVHGFESTAVNFSQYIQPLIAKGYEVLAFDSPAHGRSSGKKVTAIVIRDFLKEILIKYDPIQSFMAHSFGGLCLCLALAESKQNEEQRLALIAPATETSTAIEQFLEFVGLSDTETKKEFEKVVIEKGGYPSSWFSIHRTIPLIKGKIIWMHDEQDFITPLKDVQRIILENHAHVQFVITNGLGHRKIYRDPATSGSIIDFL